MYSLKRTEGMKVMIDVWSVIEGQKGMVSNYSRLDILSVADVVRQG